MIPRIPGTGGLAGIPYTTWKGERKEAKGAYIFFGDNDTELHVTISEVSEDNVNAEDLIGFLAAKGIINNPNEWRAEKIRDAEGITCREDPFTIAIFVRTPAP